MKKYISILSSLVLLSSIPTNSYAAKEEDPDLYELAYSLGAATDYIAIPNYRHSEERPLTTDSFIDYLHNCSILEAAYAADQTFSTTVSSGSCFGISVLEVLSHNGIIKPSDIQDGAETLSDITYSDTVDKYITYYQAAQSFTEFDNYEKYRVSSMTHEERVDDLLDTAKKCMEDDKYFLIILRGESFSHAVCGIGVSDGNWTFNDVNYDKCVLVLDSNLQSEDRIAKGFGNQVCIYINSETKQSYIPAYNKSSDDDTPLMFLAINDDTLLNYKGLINPSSKIETDTSDIKHILYSTSKNIKITPTSVDGKELPLQETSFEEKWDVSRFFKANSVRVELTDESFGSYVRYIDPDRWMDFIFNIKKYSELSYNCNIDFSDSGVSIQNRGTAPIYGTLQIRMNTDSFDFEPYYWWQLSGAIENELSVEIRNEGMLFKTNGNIEATFIPFYYEINEDGYFDNIMASIYYPESKYAYLCTRNNVLVTIDENRRINYSIDNNGDGVYDVPVRKGDINCDGKIDATDASQVLSIYSKLSTTPYNMFYEVDYSLGDISGDGKINSIDASDILDEYAKASTA